MCETRLQFLELFGVYVVHAPLFGWSDHYVQLLRLSGRSPASELMEVTISFDNDFNSKDMDIWLAFRVLNVGHGDYTTLYVCRRHLKISCVGRVDPLPTEHDKLLQPANNLAQGPPLLFMTDCSF